MTKVDLAAAVASDSARLTQADFEASGKLAAIRPGDMLVTRGSCLTSGVIAGWTTARTAFSGWGQPWMSHISPRETLTLSCEMSSANKEGGES